MKYRCVECGHGIKSLFVQYSPGNIRLMKCDNCKAVADEYIECEYMITLIDLVLHKPKAYRHLLFNVLNHQSANFQSLLWKLTFTFLLLDAYRNYLFNKHEEKGGSSANMASFTFGYWKMLMDVSLGNLMLICVFIFGTKIFLNKTVAISRCLDLLLAILVSSYFKVFLIAMMWHYQVRSMISMALQQLYLVLALVLRHGYGVNNE